MDIKSALAVSSIMFLLSGCGRVLIDYMYTTETVYRNNTGHTILLETYNPDVSVLIEGGASSSFFMYNEGDFARHVPLKASVTYDGKYSVDVVNGMDIPNNICNNSSYTVTGMSDFRQTFQYTFTEEDYEYAVSAGGSGKDGN